MNAYGDAAADGRAGEAVAYGCRVELTGFTVGVVPGPPGIARAAPDVTHGLHVSDFVVNVALEVAAEGLAVAGVGDAGSAGARGVVVRMLRALANVHMVRVA